MMKNRLLILFLPLLLSVVPAAAKGLSAEKRKEISQMLTRILDREVAGCKTNVTQVVDAGNRLTLYASIGMSYYPFRERSVAAIYDSIRSLLPASLARRRLSLVTDKHPIEELIPQIYRSGSRGKTFTNRSDRPLVTRLSSPVKPTHGLAGRHIAMWQSHGRYFDQEENRWRWQRSRLWETCEDLYTQSYVLPYLVPMLERAGANVLLPRERDVQTEEAIADNDAGVDEGSSYVEFTGDRRWFDAGAHRYLLRIESSDPALYAKLHPADHSYAARVESLRLLRKTGYQVGTGVMVGLPGQTTANLVHDLEFFKSLDVDMIGMGPYIVHHDTPLGRQFPDAGSDAGRQLELGLKMIAVTRLHLRNVNIASTTALQALAPNGRELGLLAGANVIMPNIGDLAYRKGYLLYENKPGTDENAGTAREKLERAVAAIGESIAYGEWGDSPHFAARAGRGAGE